MEETWRWFGPDDPVTLQHVRQAGATGVVSALHHLNQGRAWPDEEVAKRKGEIEAAGLSWSVVESIAVAEDIKTRTGAFRELIEDYKRSIRAVARGGVKTICYNFMAVTDWTRTELNWRLPTGGYALRFDWTDLAAYDLFVLRRPGAEADHPPERRAAAEARFRAMGESDVAALESVLIDWLPAREFRYDRAGFQRMIDVYKEVGTEGVARQPVRVRPRGGAGRGRGGRAAVHPPGRPRLSDLRAAARHVHRKRTRVPCSRRCRKRPTASPSAPAPSAAPGRTTWWRWRRSSRRASTSRICATWPWSPTAPSTRPTTSTGASTSSPWSPR